MNGEQSIRNKIHWPINTSIQIQITESHPHYTFAVLMMTIFFGIPRSSNKHWWNVVVNIWISDKANLFIGSVSITICLIILFWEGIAHIKVVTVLFFHEFFKGVSFHWINDRIGHVDWSNWCVISWISMLSRTGSCWFLGSCNSIHL